MEEKQAKIVKNIEPHAAGKWKSAILGMCAILAVIAYPCLFIYFQNAGEAMFADVLPIMGWFALGGLCLLGIFYFAMRRDISKAATLTCFAALLFLNFALIEKVILLVFPNLYYWHIAYILLCTLAVAGYVIFRFGKTGLYRQVNLIILTVFVGLTAVNGVMAIPTITQKMGGSIQAENTRSAGVVSGQVEYRPNAYLLIFDEYGGYECLREYCAYDNSAFYEALEERGFQTSKYSYNITGDTTTEVPNLLNLEQADTSEMLISQKKERLINPFLYQYMRNKGYKINIANISGFLDSNNCDYAMATTDKSKIEGSAEYYILMQTAYYPFKKHSTSADMDIVLNQLAYVESSVEISSEALCTISYLCCPHLPWFTDENGVSIDARDRNNWKDPDIYLGQLKWLNKQILATVDVIIEKDPEAIIILLSDHGFRLPSHLEQWYEIKDHGLDHKYQMNILNAVYYPDYSLDIEGKTGVDTMRTVLNALFDDNFEMLGR